MARHAYESEDYEPDHPWTHDAKCRGMAYELFEYQETSSPLAAGMNFKERLDFNQANHALAEEICIECPVFFQCLDAAGATDRRYTVRGGEKPRALEADEDAWADGKHISPARGIKLKTTCKFGHDRSQPGGRCRECRNQQKREYRARAKVDQVPDPGV